MEKYALSSRANSVPKLAGYSRLLCQSFVHSFLPSSFIHLNISWEYTIHKHVSEEMLEILTGEDISFYINLFIAKSTMNLVHWWAIQALATLNFHGAK